MNNSPRLVIFVTASTCTGCKPKNIPVIICARTWYSVCINDIGWLIFDAAAVVASTAAAAADDDDDTNNFIFGCMIWFV